jgi:hypothetical protein
LNISFYLYLGEGAMVLRPIPTKREGEPHGSLFEKKILVKSSEPGNKAQRKVAYKNYHAKL